MMSCLCYAVAKFKLSVKLDKVCLLTPINVPHRKSQVYLLPVRALLHVVARSHRYYFRITHLFKL